MDYEGLAADLLKKARDKGASAGDVVIVDGDQFDLQFRMGSIEQLSQAREKRIGLRLFAGNRTAVCSSSDFSRESLDRLVEDTFFLARATAEDPAAGLPEPVELDNPDLDLLDEEIGKWTFEDKIDLVRKTEEAALNLDPRITNSEGSGLSHSSRQVVYANTNGVSGRYPIGSVSFSMSPIATENGSMQRDFWYTVGRKLKNLETAEGVGRKAAQRALRRLGAKKIPTCKVPIIFDPETASELLGSVSACVSGSAIYKGASFLADRLGEKIASSRFSVIDDGRKKGGLGSRPFDGEGLPTRKTEVIRNGVLKSYLLDTYSGRKLGMQSTGNAARSVSDVPGVSPTNLYVVGGDSTPDEMIRSVDRGLYVVELIGFGVNHLTGDYSRGAVGLWIEKGELTYPVEEITIGGNLKEILMNIEMVGNDLEFRGSLTSPTLKIARMTVGGS